MMPWLPLLVTVRGGGTRGGRATHDNGGRPSATNRLAERAAEYNRDSPVGQPTQRWPVVFRSIALTVTKRYARPREIAVTGRDDASIGGAAMTTTFDKREEGFE